MSRGESHIQSIIIYGRHVGNVKLFFAQSFAVPHLSPRVHLRFDDLLLGLRRRGRVWWKMASVKLGLTWARKYLSITLNMSALW